MDAAEAVHAGFSLGEARLTDYQALRALRWFGEPIPDFRDRWLFLAGVAMSWVAVPQVLRRELYALAHEIGGWTEGKAHSKLSSVMSRAHAAARGGERVEFAGAKMDPRYRFRNQTIIELLDFGEWGLSAILRCTRRYWMRV